jgi:hypothetical protein
MPPRCERRGRFYYSLRSRPAQARVPRGLIGLLPLRGAGDVVVVIDATFVRMEDGGFYTVRVEGWVRGLRA